MSPAGVQTGSRPVGEVSSWASGRLLNYAVVLVVSGDVVLMTITRVNLPALVGDNALRGYMHSAWQSFSSTVFDPNYWGFLLALSALQWMWPSQKDQRRPSIALAEDTVWFFASTVLQVSVVTGFLALIGTAYVHAAGGWSFDLTPYTGDWGLAVLAFVFSDFLAWLGHWLHHHVSVLWYFHAVHHSQTNMNVLSDNRQHVVETVISAAVSYLPARLLGLDGPQAMGLAFSTIYFSAFIHANIRTDLGPLRYIFVSPQVHRVHHSSSPEHFNTNYATVFAFWDYLFGTRFEDRTAYPATGIDDPSFPHGATWNPVSLICLWVRQTVYPFGLVLKGSAAYAGNGRSPGSRPISDPVASSRDNILPTKRRFARA